MRRLVSFMGITLLALFVSGWGSMLAAALCPHAGVSQRQVATEEHNGCHAQAEPTKEHHSDSRHADEGMNDEGMHGMMAEQMPALRLHNDESNLNVLSLPARTCTHCVGRNKLPSTLVAARELTLQKRDAGSVVEQTTALITLHAVYTSQFAPTQHAPPAFTGSRHILLSVFLI